MNKIGIKNYITKGTIFEYECDNNTFRKTLERAVEDGIDLAYAEIISQELNYVNIGEASLPYAYLSKTSLIGANLTNSNLHSAVLNDTFLVNANLSGANLEYANLSGAYLEYANLSSACLINADLSNSILCNTILDNANLHGASFYHAKSLGSAVKDNARNFCVPMSCPSDGAFIAWKKILYHNGDGLGYIVKLLVPEDARRSSATSEKCRCDKAMVLAINNIITGESVNEIVNKRRFCRPTCYRVGEMVYPDSFDDNRWNECSNGIHFFVDREMAINYI
ncbi:MAG: pentapeptide repeat-containing protein [Paludibacteraceae bacterium]|nr:pentapeptide repeat-containing protein [Paludibacteraceae bacterium]